MRVEERVSLINADLSYFNKLIRAFGRKEEPFDTEVYGSRYASSENVYRLGSNPWCSGARFLVSEFAL